MGGKVTVTAPIGPGVTATALAFTDVRLVDFDPIGCVLNVYGKNGKLHSFDTRNTTTITATASAGVFTFTISQ
jgi:hypothetical protein